jgi:hypothetical protein
MTLFGTSRPSFGGKHPDCPGENIDSYRGRTDHLSVDLEGLWRIGLNVDLPGLPVIKEIIARADSVLNIMSQQGPAHGLAQHHKIKQPILNADAGYERSTWHP